MALSRTVLGVYRMLLLIPEDGAISPSATCISHAATCHTLLRIIPRHYAYLAWLYAVATLALRASPYGTTRISAATAVQKQGAAHVSVLMRRRPWGGSVHRWLLRCAIRELSTAPHSDAVCETEQAYATMRVWGTELAYGAYGAYGA
eukprot:454383-Rhodomonas_salina.4